MTEFRSSRPGGTAVISPSPPRALGSCCFGWPAGVGCGSLVCSWMNDAGFWIVAKMSGLTELEALKAWTSLLALMGFVGLGVVLLYVQLMPFPVPGS